MRGGTMKPLLRLGVILLVAAAVSCTEEEQDRRRHLFSSRSRSNIFSRRFSPGAPSTTTPTPEETTTTINSNAERINSRVRLPPRRTFGFRSPSSLKAKIEQQKAEKEDKGKTDTEVISEPQPGQEFVAFVADNASTKVVQDSKPEPKILTKPIPGQEFVAFQAPHPSPKDSVITSEDGEVVYVSVDEAPSDSDLELAADDLTSTKEAAGLDAILITPDEILPIEETAPITEAVPDYLDEEEEKDLALLLSHDQEESAVTPSPLRNVTALEPEVETSISVVTSLPMKEVEGESMHVKHHMEFEHSHVGPENDTLLSEPREHAKALLSQVEVVPSTESVDDVDFYENTSGIEHSDQENATIHEIPVLTEIKEEIVTEDPYDTTELPLEAEEASSNIEILSAATKEQQNPPVNDLYGKYFDESNLEFGKGVGDNDKLLFPSETEQKVRSKIEIKEVNGQLYEYEYIYYYDDEYPQYDYDSGAPVDVESSTSPATTTTTTTTTSTTPIPTTTPQQITTTPRPIRGRDSSRTRGRRPVVNDQEVNVIEEPSRSLERSRAALTQTSRTSRGRNNFRGRDEEVVGLDNTVHSVAVEEDKLPAQTRFPPRTTTPATPEFREREPLFPETSHVGLEEHKDIPLIPDVTGSHSPGRQTSRSGRTFNNDGTSTEPIPVFGAVAQEEITTEISPTSTISPSSRSLVNLYAFSRAADGEEIGDATTQIPQGSDYDTEIPLTNQDFIYDYDETATDYPSYLPDAVTETPESEPAAEPEPEPEPSTEDPTTSSTTTTTTTTTTTPAPTTTTEASRGFGRFSSRNRGTSRFHNRESSTASTTPEVEQNEDSNGRVKSGRLDFSRNRARNNRFRGRVGSSETEEPVSENTVDSTSEAAEQRGPTRSPLGNRNRFRPGGASSFRPRPSTKTENREEQTATTASSVQKRPRLPSRAGLFRNRFKGRGTTAPEEVSTEPTEDVAAEAPVETAIEEAEGAVEISTESAVSASSAPLTTSSAPLNQRTRGRPTLSRHRFGVRGSTKSPQESSVSEPQDEATHNDDDTGATQAPRVTPTRGRDRFSRPLASRLSSRLGSRNRDNTPAEKPEVQEEPVAAEELPSEDQPQDHPAEELTEQEAPANAPEETAQGTQTRGQHPPARGGVRNVLGRFRNRSPQSSVTTTAKPAKREETAQPPRRAGLSALFTRRRKPVSGGEVTEEPHVQESELPADESQPNDDTVATEVQHSEGEPEQVPEEAAPVAEAQPLEAVEEETPAEEPTTDEPPRRRFSLFNRRRNRN